MRCPLLDELPSPPPEKTGWPWTQGSENLPELMADGRPWPKITIVTPNYNYGRFLEETIRSVLLQGYPNLEYIIIDGGSRDDSVAIIKKYEKWLSSWVSEKDRGQSHAINKGFLKATGAIVGWLNSDDLYLPQAFQSVALCFTRHPGIQLFYGKCRRIDMKSQVTGDIWKVEEFSLEGHLVLNRIPQQSCFWSPQLFSRVGYLREDWDLIMDYEYWFRVAAVSPILFIPEYWADFREHAQQKSGFFSDLVGERFRLYWELRRKGFLKTPSLHKAWRYTMALQFRTLGSIRLQEGHRTTALVYYFASFIFHWEKLLDFSALYHFFLRLASR